MAKQNLVKLSTIKDTKKTPLRLMVSAETILDLGPSLDAYFDEYIKPHFIQQNNSLVTALTEIGYLQSRVATLEQQVTELEANTLKVEMHKVSSDEEGLEWSDTNSGKIAYRSDD